MSPPCADTTEGKQVLWPVVIGHVCGISAFRIHIIPHDRIASTWWLQTGTDMAEVFQIATAAFQGRRRSFPL